MFLDLPAEYRTYLTNLLARLFRRDRALKSHTFYSPYDVKKTIDRAGNRQDARLIVTVKEVTNVRAITADKSKEIKEENQLKPSGSFFGSRTPPERE